MHEIKILSLLLKCKNSIALSGNNIVMKMILHGVPGKTQTIRGIYISKLVL